MATRKQTKGQTNNDLQNITLIEPHKHGVISGATEGKAVPVPLVVSH